MNATVDNPLVAEYLELLKGALSHTLYGRIDRGQYTGRNAFSRAILALMRSRGVVPVRTAPNAEQERLEGRDCPIFAQTMVGRARLDNLQWCIENVLRDGVPGDLIETGTWRGGAAILMRGVLRAHGVNDRVVYVADSFAGLPAPDVSRYPADTGSHFHESPELAVSLDEVRQNFSRYGLLDEGVRFLEGWFRDTLPTVRDRRWAVLRLDGDMYESTIDALSNLYDGLEIGGYVIVDDYSIAACRAAVADFRAEREIADDIHAIDWTGVWWRRSR